MSMLEGVGGIQGKTYNKTIAKLSCESDHRCLKDNQELELSAPVQWIHRIRRRSRHKRDAIRIIQNLDIACGLVVVFLVQPLLHIFVGAVSLGGCTVSDGLHCVFGETLSLYSREQMIEI